MSHGLQIPKPHIAQAASHGSPLLQRQPSPTLAPCKQPASLLPSIMWAVRLFSWHVIHAAQLLFQLPMQHRKPNPFSSSYVGNQDMCQAQVEHGQKRPILRLPPTILPHIQKARRQKLEKRGEIWSLPPQQQKQWEEWWLGRSPLLAC